MSDYNFTEDGWSDYIYWQGQDKKTLSYFLQTANTSFASLFFIFSLLPI